MLKKSCTRIIALVLLINGILSLNGAEINVTTPVTKTTVQNAIDSASAGDIVLIPAGTWNIDGTVYLKEEIHVKGAGKSLTILIKIDTASTEMFKLVAKLCKPFKISGIAFMGEGKDVVEADLNSTLLDIGIGIYGKAIGFQIYDCYFEGFSHSAIRFSGTQYEEEIINGHPIGVINNNEFIDNYIPLGAPVVLGYGVSIMGDNSWPSELQLGNNNALFIENNYFENSKHDVSSRVGSRYVFRHNISDHSYLWTAAIDSHGKIDSTHGSRSYEIYNNTITCQLWELWNIPGTYAIGLRGGDGVVFNNTIIDSIANFVQIEHWTSEMTYPVADQIMNLWSWNNTQDSIVNNEFLIGVTEEQNEQFAPLIQNGRNIYVDQQKPGYEPYFYPHPTSSCNGHWKLANNNNIQVDNSASGNNGVAVGPVNTTGYCGNALYFDEEDRVTVPYTPELNTSEFTVSAWVKVTGGNGTHRAPILSRDLLNYAGYNIYAGNNEKWQFWTGTGTGYNVLTGEPVEYNKWTHIAATHDGTVNKLYVNGIEASKTATAYSKNISSDFLIGGGNSYYHFRGMIDDVKYYSRALSKEEIKAMYNWIPDSSFEKLIGDKWIITSGNPTMDTNDKYDGAQSIYFNKVSSGSTQVMVKQNSYIPANGGETYTISAWIKGENIVQGSEAWYRPYIIGRWYDKNMNQISGFYPDLNTIGTGTFSWSKFEHTFTAPSTAAYYRIINAGMVGDCHGKVWMDLIGFGHVSE